MAVVNNSSDGMASTVAKVEFLINVRRLGCSILKLQNESAICQAS
jgi:hypothetical protein